jgi:hypothetical protein
MPEIKHVPKTRLQLLRNSSKAIITAHRVNSNVELDDGGFNLLKGGRRIHGKDKVQNSLACQSSYSHPLFSSLSSSYSTYRSVLNLHRDRRASQKTP